MNRLKKDLEFWSIVANYLLERAPANVCAEALCEACKDTDLDAHQLAQEIFNSLNIERNKKHEIASHIEGEWGDYD